MIKDARTTTDENDRLARLGRQWFAEVRRADPERKPDRKRQDAGDSGPSDAQDGFWSSLFGSDDGGDCSGDGGSD